MSFNLRSIPPVTLNVMAVCILIWVLSLVVPSLEEQMLRYLSLHYWSSPDFNPAQLFTYMFLHGSLWHLAFNMLTLYSFGCLMERAMGSKRFLFYYVVCGVGAALIQEAVLAVQLQMIAGRIDPELLHSVNEYLRQGQVLVDPPAAVAEYYAIMYGISVGASGAIFGVLLATAAAFPDLKMYLMFVPVPIKAKWGVLVFCVAELMFGVTGTLPGIGHFAHLGGALVGLIVLLIWKKKGVYRGRLF